MCSIIDNDTETVIPAEVGWDGSQAYIVCMYSYCLWRRPFMIADIHRWRYWDSLLS